MVKHVILWKLKDNFSEEEKLRIKKEAKANLEALVGVVPGLTQMHIQIDSLATSNADMMLESVLESEEALKGYATHPAHVKVADENVRPFVETRMCLDYTI